jgi:hypothetical protein
MAHDNKTLEELGRHNTARFFTENRHVSWVLLIAVIVWGIYGYLNIPQRKDPEIPVRLAVAITPWPGVDALKIEELVTQAVERTAAESKAIHPASDRSFGLKSVTLPGVSIVQIQLDESIDDTEKAFNDINLKLNSLNDQLPQGAGPIQFNSNFGDTAALLLTVASPKESDVEISLRARDIRKVLEAERGQLPAAQAEARAALIVAFPRTVNPRAAERGLRALLDAVRAKGFGHDLQLLQGSGFIGLDGHFDGDDKAIRPRPPGRAALPPRRLAADHRARPAADRGRASRGRRRQVQLPRARPLGRRRQVQLPRARPLHDPDREEPGECNPGLDRQPLGCARRRDHPGLLPRAARVLRPAAVQDQRDPERPQYQYSRWFG